MQTRTLCLSLVLVAAIGAGCQESTVGPQLGGQTHRVESPALAVGGFASSFGTTVYSDGSTWDGWTFLQPDQLVVDVKTGAKWVAFAPEGNKGYSPAFSQRTDQFRVDCEVYLPEGLPLSGANDDGPSTLIALLSYDPNTLPRPDVASYIGIELNRDGDWRLRATSAMPGTGVVWGTSDRFVLSARPQPGWNTIHWTLITGPDDDDDFMEITIGDRTQRWENVDVMGPEDRFNYVRVGNWRDRRGERSFAVRSLEVTSFRDDAPPPTEPPPTEPPPTEPPPTEPPPTEPPPTEPPPPSEPPLPPPPDGDVARGGYVIPEGFWKDWRVRTHASGSNCEGSPCIRFFDRGGYGSFRAGSQAMRFIGDDTDGRGQLSYRIRFDHGQLDTGVGGKHLFNLTSLPLAFTPPEIGLDNWTRVDFNQPRAGQIRATVFNRVNGTALNGSVWPSHWFDVPFAVDQWGSVDIRWHQEDDRLTLTVNGESHTFDLLPGSPNVGNYIAFGNIYNVEGEIDVDDIAYQQ